MTQAKPSSSLWKSPTDDYEGIRESQRAGDNLRVYKGSRWEATVPSNLEGEYIVELYAENDAGNQAYICTALFAITGHTLQGYIVPRGYTVEAGMQDYTGFPTISEFLCSLLEKKYSGIPEKTEYAAEISEGGYTIEYAVCKRTDG
ncbi:MAG: PF13754 domain-containing protein [Lachnospiraceae bacterium]|nr:PF13754 domain-containing protein [Lachnospiraceae bacterium]